MIGSPLYSWRTEDDNEEFRLQLKETFDEFVGRSKQLSKI